MGRTETIEAPPMPALQPVASAGELLRAPIGRYLAGHSFLIWILSPTLAGSMYFGRPDERDLPSLLELFALPLHDHLRPPFDALIDTTRISGLGPELFEFLLRHLAGTEALTERVRRVACLRPPGMTGALIAGVFYERVQPRFPAALFTDEAEGFQWLDRSNGEAERREVARVVSSLVSAPASLRGLRDWLPANLVAPTVEGAARSLALSSRSLQRSLQAAGTSFRQEVDRARVRSAESLLQGSDDKIESIGRQIGCSSASHFATLFRRVTGETPGDFRARRR